MTVILKDTPGPIPDCGLTEKQAALLELALNASFGVAELYAMIDTGAAVVTVNGLAAELAGVMMPAGTPLPPPPLGTLELPPLPQAAKTTNAIKGNKFFKM